MSRTPRAFRPSDVTRVIKAAEAAGIKVGRVEVDKAGKISIVAGHAQTHDPPANDLDAWIANHANAAQGH